MVGRDGNAAHHSDLPLWNARTMPAIEFRNIRQL